MRALCVCSDIDMRMCILFFFSFSFPCAVHDLSAASECYGGRVGLSLPAPLSALLRCRLEFPSSSARIIVAADFFS